MAKESIFNPIPYLLMVPLPKIWVDYNENLDVLNISFRNPDRADESVWVEENIVYHYQDEEFVGITVFEAAATFGNVS